jgi:23S rRNA (guanosine2251-2'-O)-methyltransferase
MDQRKPPRHHPKRRHGGAARPPASNRGADRTRSPRTTPGLWLFGAHAVLAALANPRRRLQRLLLTGEAARRHGPEIEQLLARRGEALSWEEVAREEIDSQLPPGAVHQGLALAVSPLAQPALETFVESLPAGPAVLLILDQVTDPHNVGAILRSSAVFGASALVNTERHAALETGTLAKSASGALELVPYLQVINLARSLDWLKEAGFWVVGMAEEAPATLARQALPERLAICLGAEGSGLRRLTRERCDLLVKLPAQGAFCDLNVSNAAAVALYELIGRDAGPDSRK